MKNLSATLGMALLSVTTALAQKPTIEFNARGIVALSDGDMAASASVDGKLLKQVGVKDALTVYPLPIKQGQEVGSSPFLTPLLDGPATPPLLRMGDMRT